MNKLTFAVAILAAGAAMAALPDRFNLREKDKMLAGYAAKEQDPKAKPFDRAMAGLDRRTLEMLTCEDKDLAAKEKAVEDFIANPGIKDGPLVDFYFALGRDPFRRAECFKRAEAAAMASTNAAVRLAFYAEAAKKCTPGEVHWGYWNDGEDEIFCTENKYAWADRADKDPLLADLRAKGRVPSARWRLEADEALAKWDRVEEQLKAAVSAVPVEKLRDRIGPSMALAQFYEKRAYRWYGDEDAATLRKAYGLWEMAEVCGCGSRARFALADLALKLGEPKNARKWLQKEIDASKDKKPAAEVERRLGDVAYAEKDWKAAAAWYDAFAGHSNTNGDWRTIHKFAGAFHAAGDDAKALAFLRVARQRCGNGYEQPHLDAEINVFKAKLGK